MVRAVLSLVVTLVPHLDVMQVHIADFSVTLPKLDSDVREHAGGGGHEDILGLGAR
jgi:hypothetical protein